MGRVGLIQRSGIWLVRKLSKSDSDSASLSDPDGVFQYGDAWWTGTDTATATDSGSVSTGGGTADPTGLPVATGQTRQDSAYNALGVPSLAAGASYSDPATGHTIFKVTSATYPETNSWSFPDYAAGGPYISMPWTSGGKTFYTLYFRQTISGVGNMSKFVDFNYTDETFTNARDAHAVRSGYTDLLTCFSYNPATPRICYMLDRNGSDRMDRFDTDTMTLANTGDFAPNGHTWPSGNVHWLQNDINDDWFCCSHDASGNQYAWRASDGTAYTVSGLNGSDEPHIDRAGNYVACIMEDTTPSVHTSARFLRLSDGAVLTPGTRTGGWSRGHNNHPDGQLGYFMFRSSLGADGFACNPTRRFDPSIATSASADPDMYYDPLEAGCSGQSPALTSNSGHSAGQWCIDNDADASKAWYVFSAWGGTAGVMHEAIGFVRIDGSDVRIMCHHYSPGDSDYGFQPRATVSPDGKVVMWLSGMNGTSRTDVFLAKTPVS